MAFLGQVTDSWTVITGGAAVAFLSLLIGAIYRIQNLTPKLYDKPIALLDSALKERGAELGQLKEDVEALQRHVRECEYTNDLLIRSLQIAGLKVPAEVFLRRRRINDD